MKGTTMSLVRKKRFWNLVRGVSFSLYTLVVEKAALPPPVRRDDEALYGDLAVAAMELVPVALARPRLIVTLDRDKRVLVHEAVNRRLRARIQRRVPSTVPVEVYAVHSHENRGLQVVDTFVWGVFRKYERGDTAWYDVFRSAVRVEERYDVTGHRP